MTHEQLDIRSVAISKLKSALYNPRKWSEEATGQLTESIQRFGLVDPILVNGAEGRDNIVIGGHFRLKVAKDLGYKEVPVVYLDISDEAKERELNLRLNRNLGDWDFDLLAKFDQSLLSDVGFESKEIDIIFDSNADTPEQFDLEKELKKLDIKSVEAKPGDVYQLDNSRLMVGDSTIATDMQKLMNGERADMCLTDPPYLANYSGGIRHGKPTTDSGPKRNRRYLETETIPEDFTTLWMQHVADSAKPDFSIIVYENWKNLHTIWSEMKVHWTVQNMIVWHIPNRHQGFAAQHKFFSKYDIAMVGASGTVPYNDSDEADGLQEEYETALYAISGKPHWEQYDKKDKKRPSDFIQFEINDKKYSGQDVVFGTKPIEILVPYIKILTKRGDLIVEPFCGSGSTLIAATKLNRRCYVMEKSPVYAEVALKRWGKLTGKERVKIDGTHK